MSRKERGEMKGRGTNLMTLVDRRAKTGEAMVLSNERNEQTNEQKYRQIDTQTDKDR